MIPKFITTRPHSSQSLLLDWDTPGTIGSQATIDNSNRNYTINGNTVSVHHELIDADGIPQDLLFLRHQTDPNGIRDWPGNFAPNDAVLWTNNIGMHDGEIGVDFKVAVTSAGAQIQTRQPGKKKNGTDLFFTARIKAYDGALLVAAFDMRCKYTKDADNSSQFIGVSADRITRIEFRVGDPVIREFYVQGFAINKLTLQP